MEENDRTRHQAATPPTTDHREALRLHNTARARKTLKPLQWDKKLETDAKAYARRSLPRISWYTLQVPSGQGRGRISLISTAKILDAVTRGTKGWLAEEKNYKGQKIPEGNIASYGHWTQCMWKSSTKMGIAAASDGKGAYYTVARYSPPGNYGVQKPY